MNKNTKIVLQVIGILVLVPLVTLATLSVDNRNADPWRRNDVGSPTHRSRARLEFHG